jgi:preprotein translocase subunit SecG
MLNIIISLLTFVLILVSLFMVLVILMQRGNSNSGMGSAFGGGVAESAFGAETTNILTRATKWSAVAFFVIALSLYLMYMSQQGSQATLDDTAPPEMSMMETPVPATTAETTPGEAAAEVAEGMEDATPTSEAVADEVEESPESDPAP